MYKYIVLFSHLYLQEGNLSSLRIVSSVRTSPDRNILKDGAEFGVDIGQALQMIIQQLSLKVNNSYPQSLVIYSTLSTRPHILSDD